jgi:hypothetical protein
MVIGYSIRKSAEIVKVGVKTSFYMRHKILDCIGTFIGTGHVDGIVEMDETLISIGSSGYNVLKMIKT